MDAIEIIEILAMVNDMENISKVEIELGDNPKIVVEKGVSKPKPVTRTPEPEKTYTGFGKATTLAPEVSSPNLATQGQRKYAGDLRDFMNEAGVEDNDIIYGLANALEEVSDDILHPSQWRDKMSRQQADAYITILELQRKQLLKQKRGGMQ